MEDLTSQLRIGFCSLIVQAKGDAINSFVAWLDLKVAEYKVYGHMILTEDESEREHSSSWQPTTNKPAKPFGSQAFRFNRNQTGVRKHRGVRRPPMKGLAKGLSAMRKSAMQSQTGVTYNHQYNGDTTENQSRDLYNNVPVKTEALDEPQNGGASSDVSYNLSDVVELDSDGEYGQNAVDVKSEPGFDQSVGQEPAFSQPGYLPTQFPVTSQSSPHPLPQNRSLPSQFRSPGPKPKPASHVVSPAKTFSGVRRASPMSGSVSGLLSTHTIETEADVKKRTLSSLAPPSEHRVAHYTDNECYQCKLCSRVIKSPYNAVQHIKEVHLKIVNHHCPVCLTGFNRPCKLTEHLKKHHPEVTYE